MPVEYRPDDPVRTEDDIVLRAGGGSVDNLVAKAIENAPDYTDLVAAGHVRSRYTISVHIPREDRASLEDILKEVPYILYRPYLEATANDLLAIPGVDIVATTLVRPGHPVSDVDLCHYDVVIEAADEDDLRSTIVMLREKFAKHGNPAHER